MAEHDRSVGPHGGRGIRAGELSFLQRQIDDVAGMQQRLPSREQIIQPDPDRDAGIDTGDAKQRFDGFAAMRIRTVGAGDDDQFRSLDRRAARQLRID